MTKKKNLKNDTSREHHDLLKLQAEHAIEELLQDKGVSIAETLESMEDLYSLIESNIEGLRDDIEKGWK